MFLDLVRGRKAEFEMKKLVGIIIVLLVVIVMIIFILSRMDVLKEASLKLLGLE